MPPVKKVEDQPILVSTSKYPDYAKFGFEFFNPVQSRVFEFYNDDCNFIIAAATSAGKTAISEMVAAAQLRERGGKIIYLAPMKALAKEKYDDWTDPKHHFSDMKISVCTGDYRLTPARQKELAEANIVIMTSEMLNSKIRSPTECEFLKDAKVCIVDECHLLTVPGRGDHLEVGLMNLSKVNKDCRYVMLSATMPNVIQIADWTSYVLNGKETYLLESKYRPCPLGVHYETYEAYGTYDQQERAKVDKALEIIQDNLDDKFLLFVHTKRTGELLKTAMIKAGYDANFHSADLDKTARENLESTFKDKNGLKYLIATSTLAWGCYAKNTLVSMSDGTLKHIQNIVVGDNVLSYDGLNLINSAVVKTGGKEVTNAIKITLESGETATVSEDHEFYSAVMRKSPNWNKACKLEIGDFIAVPNALNVRSSCESDDYGYLCGYVIGDGSISKVGRYADGVSKLALDISFGHDEFVHIAYIEELLNRVCEKYKFRVCEDSNGVFHIVTKKRSIVDKFKHLMKPGRNKHKLSLMNLDLKNSSFMKGLLQGLFDTDGGFSSHSNNNTSIEFTSISKKLVNEIQQILIGFGVRSCVSKKKMKDTVINGRFQKATRKYIYRVRIYGKDVCKFIQIIGFKNPYKKAYSKYFSEQTENKKFIEKDFLPARSLFKSHVDELGVSHKDIRKIGCDTWNIVNKQELSRNKALEIIEKYDANTDFKSLAKGDLRWSKIKSIVKIETRDEFYDIEVENHHNFIGNGMISHNCNLPARRVIILGVHRGLEEVATYDIWQECGRAGRPLYDPRGDVYILLPDKYEDKHRNRIKKQQNIDSKLLDNIGGHYKTLAFHLVSEIHHGRIKTRDDVRDWYERTFAHFQAKHLEDDVLNSTITLLLNCGAIKEQNGILVVTVVGMVSSMFYYSPFDVADLRRNFMTMFKADQENDELWLSMALGNVDSLRLGIVSKAEREDMGIYQSKIWKEFGKDTFLEPAIKGGFAYYSLLTGSNAGLISILSRTLQWDYPRLSQVLSVLDSMGCKWDKGSYFKELESRVFYGVRPELVKFVKLPDIGKVRAERLWGLGFRNLQDIVDKADVVKTALNFKLEKTLELVQAAKNLILVGED